MRFETYMDVDRKNKILLEKMGHIMQGNYFTSTSQVHSSIESNYIISSLLTAFRIQNGAEVHGKTSERPNEQIVGIKQQTLEQVKFW